MINLIFVFAAHFQINETFAPIIVMQPFREFYPINLYGENLFLSNTSYSYNNVTNPSDNRLKIETPNYFHKLSHTTFTQHFCPVYDWAPLFQPVHFYLSQTQIDLVIYNSNQTIDVITQQISKSYIDNNDNDIMLCYSMFPIAEGTQFAVDCDYNETQKVFLVYTLEIDENTLIISNFTYQNMVPYVYANSTYDEMINKCESRVTTPFSILEYSFQEIFLQYCPTIRLIDDIFSASYYFYTIYNYTYENDQLYLNATQWNSTSITNSQNTQSIQQIYVNSLLERYNDDTWTLLFFFERDPGIYKCQFSIQYEWRCIYTILEMISTDAIRTIQNLDQDIIIATWTDAAIFIIYLAPSVLDDDYQTLIFKDVFERGYRTVDVSVTKQYLAVMMSDENGNQTIREEMCKGSLYNSTADGYNLLKVYAIEYISQKPYVVEYIPNNAMFLNSLNYASFGDYFIYFQTSENRQDMTLIQLYSKLLIVHYEYDFNQSYPDVIVAQIDVNGLIEDISVNLHQYFVFCFQGIDDTATHLVAHMYLLNKTELPLLKCPAPTDNQVFFSTTNSINLLDGIVGPLLQFDYIPSPTHNRYYPYYLNFAYKVNKDKLFLTKEIYQIYRAITNDLFETYNGFGSISMLLSFQDHPNMIYSAICQISVEQTKHIHLDLKYCDVDKMMNISLLDQVDQLQQIDKYWIAIQYANSKICLCQTTCTEVLGIHSGINITQIEVSKGPQLGDNHYFILTMFFDIFPSSIFFSQFNISDGISPGIIISQSYQQLKYDDAEINSFRYAYINQDCLLVLTTNGFFNIVTQGPVVNYSTPIFYNYSIEVFSMATNLCTIMKDKKLFGFDVTRFSENRENVKSLIVWCSNDKESYVYQYQISSIYEVDFWRQLPLYDQILSEVGQVFTSGLQFYVPVLSEFPKVISYLVYNLLDFSPKMLISQFYVEISNNFLITKAVMNIYDVPLFFDEVSFSLIVSDVDFFLYYLNQNAKFVFNLEREYYYTGTNPLVILVSQPQLNDISLFRNYSIIFDFRQTKIASASEEPIKVFLPDKSKFDPTISLNSSGYDVQLLLIKESVFQGPIVNYKYYCPTPDVIVYPSPFLQVSKYLGTYMDTINQFGLVYQILSLDYNDYLTLYLNNTAIPNAEEYQDLLVALTGNYLLFYQKQSYKSENPFQDCDQFSSPVNSSKECSIRLLNRTHVLLPVDPILCKMQLNQLNQILILCQFILTKTSYTEQYLYLVNYDYNRTSNTLSIQQNFAKSTLFCYCFFYEMQPFLYEGTVYQIMKHSYIHQNTFFGIYTITESSDDGVQITNKKKLPNPSDRPYGYANDYSFVLQKHELLLFILQIDGLIIQPLSLRDWRIERRRQVLPYLLKDADHAILHNELTFVSTVNQTSTDEALTVLIGNYDSVWEIRINLTTALFNLTHTFRQYLLCEHFFFQRPQFIVLKNVVVYLVTICMNYAFQYTGIQEEMSYLFGEPPGNILYLSLFRRNTSSFASDPVFILEPELVSSQRDHFTKFQLYFVKTNEMARELPLIHLLISNSTYFLIDYTAFSNQGYYLAYPKSLVPDNNQIELFVEAYNQYSQKEVQYLLTWHISPQFNNMVWFYCLLGIIGGILFCLCIYFLVHCLKDHVRYEEIEEDGNVDIEMIDPKSRMRKQSQNLLDEAIRQIVTNNK